MLYYHHYLLQVCEATYLAVSLFSYLGTSAGACAPPQRAAPCLAASAQVSVSAVHIQQSSAGPVHL